MDKSHSGILRRGNISYQLKSVIFRADCNLASEDNTYDLFLDGIDLHGEA